MIGVFEYKYLKIKQFFGRFVIIIIIKWRVYSPRGMYTGLRSPTLKLGCWLFNLKKTLITKSPKYVKPGHGEQVLDKEVFLILNKKHYY